MSEDLDLNDIAEVRKQLTKTVEVGYHPVVIHKLFGPLVFSSLRITPDAKTCEWVIERQWIKSGEWIEWMRIPGQIPQEFTEQEED